MYACAACAACALRPTLLRYSERTTFVPSPHHQFQYIVWANPSKFVLNMNEHHHFFFYFKVKTCNHAQHCCHAHTPATARPEPTPRKLPQCDRHFCFAFMTMHKIVHTLHIIQFCFLYLYIYWNMAQCNICFSWITYFILLFLCLCVWWRYSIAVTIFIRMCLFLDMPSHVILLVLCWQPENCSRMKRHAMVAF